MNNSLTNIGAKLKLLRESSGFTQANIANYLNVDQSLISKLESGERSISADMLEKLVILFGCDLTMLNDGAECKRSLSFAFRANEIAAEDLEAIYAINTIALNSNFMQRLLER